MKKVLAILLSAALVLTMFGGCGSEAVSSSGAAASTSETGKLSADKLDIPDVGDVSMSIAQADLDNITASQGTGSGGAASTELVSGQTSLDGAAYVLIYNPLIYDDGEDPVVYGSRSTGSIGDQISVSTNRAGGLELDVSSNTMSQSDLNAMMGDVEIQSEGRASGLSATYQVGDTESFYYFSSISNSTREEGVFTCVYAGEHCNIWSLDGAAISESDAQNYGKEFDSNIYEQDVEEFGEPRFADAGAKVNMLCYPMGASGTSCVLGFFCMLDLLAREEVTAAQIEQNMINTDCEIININTSAIDRGLVDDTTVTSTMSHEFQHMIAATDYLDNNNVPMMSTWLNEAMSAYAEDYIYPGIKEQNEYNLMFYVSDNYRYGQSLYNFYDANDPYIGDYGVVYLFENYIRGLAGESVFADVHENWRTATSNTYTEGDALADSVSADVKADIDAGVEYPASVEAEIGNENDVWLSKLTLDFYLETLSPELGNLGDYSSLALNYMVYDKTQAADIEGGGRIIVATQNNSFTIPEDADGGLVYIGLDENFNVITDAICTEYSDAGSASATSNGQTATPMSAGGSGQSGIAWNGSRTSAIVIPSVHDASVNDLISELDEDYQIAGISKSEIDQSSSTVSGMASALSSYSGYGFVTIVAPEDATDYSALADAMSSLEQSGTLVTLITDSNVSTLAGWAVAVDYSTVNCSLGDLCTELSKAIAVKVTNALCDLANGDTTARQYFTVS